MPEDPVIAAHYDRAVDAYEAAARGPLREHRTWPTSESLLPELNGTRVLDAGCGPGVHAAAMGTTGATVEGIDLSRSMIEHARTEYGDRATFSHGDIRTDLCDRSADAFDAILCQLTLSHIAELEPVFAGFAHVLRPGGIAVVVGHHPLFDYLVVRERDYPQPPGAYDLEIEPEVLVDRHPPRYHDTEPYAIRWAPAADPVRYYRRPLSALLDGATTADFAIDRIVEAEPDETFRAERSDSAAAMAELPPEILGLRLVLDD